MSKVFRIDFYDQSTNAWDTLIEAYTISTASLFLTSLDGWVESPTLNRNSATPLFSDGAIDSPFGYFSPRFFEVGFTFFGTETDADDLRLQLQTVEQMRNTNFRCYLGQRDDAEEVVVRYEYLDCVMDSEWITLWNQKNGAVEFALAFKANNPALNYGEGEIPVGD